MALLRLHNLKDWFLEILNSEKFEIFHESLGFRVNRIAYFAKAAGIAATIGAGALQIAKGVKTDNSRDVSKGIIGIGTNYFGGLGGEALGAYIGSCIFPGVGTFLGGIAGGVGAATASTFAAEHVVDKLHNRFGNDICEECRLFMARSTAEIAQEHRQLIQQLEESKTEHMNSEEANRNLQEELDEQRKQLANELRNNRNKYEEIHPIPDFLKHHKRDHPNSFYIQIIGARGSGKSTFINRFFQKAELRFISI